jgi:class 3 adenylate cyclase
VTFLFTDIERSTLRWKADTAVMRKALAAQDEVMRYEIEAHGASRLGEAGPDR